MLTAAAAAGVHRVVLCTSAMVYGALPDNDVPLAEDAAAAGHGRGDAASATCWRSSGSAAARRAPTPG